MKENKNFASTNLELHGISYNASKLDVNHNCLHCGKAINKGVQFCCKGCGVAHKFLHELNLEKYYQQVREIFQVLPQSVEIDNNYNYEEHITLDEDHNASITLHIPQIVCGACVWLIEKTLQKTFGNLSASVNFAHKSLNLRWNSKQLNFSDILKIINKIGYNAIPITVDDGYNSAKVQEREMLKRIGISGLSTFFTMMLSICIWAGHADGSMDSFTRYIFYIISFMVVIPSIFYCADIFFIKALKGLKNKHLDFNLSISLAILSTVVISIYTTFGNASVKQYAYFDSAISFIFILLIGKYLEMKVKNNAIYSCSPRHRLENNQYDVIVEDDEYGKLNKHQGINVIAKYPSQIVKDDLILIKKGQSIPIDCVLESEFAQIDSSILSGESVAQNFVKGEEIRAGSINLSSAIRVRAIRIYEESFLHKLQLEVESISCTSRVFRIANRLANLFTPIILLCSVFTFSYWFYFKNSTLFDSLYTTTTLLIITCPCAIGIAIPLASFAVISKLSNYGIIVKNSQALETMRSVKNIVFDKTGTLTNVQPRVVISKGIKKHDMDSLFTISSLSAHPFSRSINNALNGCKMLDHEDFQEVLGQGVQVKIDGNLYKLGNARFTSSMECESTLFFKTPQQTYKIEYVDELREGAKELIEFFESIGMAVWIISGDSLLNVARIAGELSIPPERFIANASSQDKFKKCARIGSYIMVGDGLNDSMALKSAGVSISHFEGADFSKHNSDIVFDGNNLLKIKIIYKIAQKFRRVVWQNFCCSVVYNLIALPIAFLGYTTPLKAAIFMSTSSLCVIFNSLKLKRFKAPSK